MERFIERTVNSALAQTYAAMKVLVIDDGSSDGTQAILARMGNANPGLRVVRTTNAGVAAARNKGIELADTLYVALLDGDDLWHPEKIQCQVEALAAHGHSREWAVSYTSFRVIDENDIVLGDGIVARDRGDIFARHMDFNPVGNGSNLLVRRDAALEVGGFNSSYAAQGIGGCEDVEFQLKLARNHKFEATPQFLLGYRIHARQMSGNLLRMRAGEIAVVDHVTSARGVPPELRRRGLVHVYFVAFKALLKTGKWRPALRYLERSARFAPLLTAREMLWVIKEEVLFWAEYLRGILSKAPVRENIGRPFAQVDPGAGLGERLPKSAWYRWTLWAGSRSAE